MQADLTTLRDLSIFAAEGTQDVFSLIDHCTTQAGRSRLRKHLLDPPASLPALMAVQEAVQYLSERQEVWPDRITNGTLVMIEKFFEDAGHAALPPSALAIALAKVFRKVLTGNEYAFIEFSLSHLSDFFVGCRQLAMAHADTMPVLLREQLAAMAAELDHPVVNALATLDAVKSYRRVIQLGYDAHRQLKGRVQRLVGYYAQIDALHSMAMATAAQGWIFPTITTYDAPMVCVKGLVHPLLEHPVPGDVALEAGKRFMLLTGANMSGKSTLMRALGVAAYLAHLGMGVPAASMELSFFRAIITNMQVQDSLQKGESLFFAEVQRIKATALRLLDQAPCLVLLDELFKGTNVHDAYECTRAVADGLLQLEQQIFILSTHLYELAQHFTERSDIRFAYFATHDDAAGNFHFDYRLEEGISDDRIGFRILQKEGVIDLLRRGSK